MDSSWTKATTHAAIMRTFMQDAALVLLRNESMWRPVQITTATTITVAEHMPTCHCVVYLELSMTEFPGM